MSAVEAGPKPFAKAAKKFRPKESKVLAIRHEGPSLQYPTKRGVESAHNGDYVVQVGFVTKTETVPPSMSKDGQTRVPGEIRTVDEPVFEVMKAEDFEALYEPAT